MAVEIRAATYAALRTALAAGTYQAGQMVFCEGRAAAGDGGQGPFQVKYDAGGGFVDHGGVTITSADGKWAADRLRDVRLDTTPAWVPRAVIERGCDDAIPQVASYLRGNFALIVDGTAGAGTLTVTGGDTLADAGTGVWAAALYYPTSDRWEFNMVRSISGSTVNLVYPLSEDISGGTLGNRWAAASSQHLSDYGGYALADTLYDLAPVVLQSRQAIYTHLSRDSWYATPWVGPIQYSAQSWRLYGGIAANQVKYGGNVANVSQASGAILAADKIHAKFTADAAGEGLELPIPMLGASGRLVIDVGHSSADQTLEGQVEIVCDGVSVHTETFRGCVQRVAAELPPCDEALVRVTAVGSELVAAIGNVHVFPDSPPSLFANGQRILVVGDSWTDTAQYPGFVDRLKERVVSDGGGLTTVGVGGTQASYALAEVDGVRRIDGWLDQHRPDVCVLHFYINDHNASVPAATWMRNMLLLVDACLAKHVKPIVILPGSTSSISQYQAMYESYLRLAMTPALVGPEPFTSFVESELSDADGVANVRRKRPGRVAINETNDKAYYAAGGAGTDTWVAFDTGASPATITPA